MEEINLQPLIIQQIKLDKFNIEYKSKVEESLQAIFPDNWDIHYNNDDLFIYIKFPLITITNSKKKKHVIKDLYVKLNYTYDMQYNKNIKCIEGFKETYTYPEYLCSYKHSHLSTYVKTNFSKFCVGSGTEMDILINEQSQNDYKFVQENFEQFLYLIDTYVRWESIEGTPYCYFSEISIFNEIETLLSESQLEQGYIEFLKNVNEFECNYNESSKLFDINNKYIKNKLSKLNVEKIYITNSGKYIYSNLDEAAIKNFIEYENLKNNNIIFLFKKRPIKIKIEDYNINLENTYTPIAHPELVIYVVNKLKEINMFYLTKYGK
mgnify:CR=1 FL=1